MSGPPAEGQRCPDHVADAGPRVDTKQHWQVCPGIVRATALQREMCCYT
jgi:hypothetical protein